MALRNLEVIEEVADDALELIERVGVEAGPGLGGGGGPDEPGEVEFLGFPVLVLGVGQVALADFEKTYVVEQSPIGREAAGSTSDAYQRFVLMF